MTDCRTDLRPSRAARRGLVLVLVLVVVAILALVSLAFAELMRTERAAAQVAAERVQARLLAESGIAFTRQLLARGPQWQDDLGGIHENAAQFRGVLVLDPTGPAGPGRFTVVSPGVEAGEYAGLRFGLEDESTRLNLNALLLLEQTVPGAGRELLLGLPGMTVDIADAILDWMDLDDEPREFGAELDYYAVQVPPYAPKNGPLETVEELLLVRGVTPWLLFGGDANRNFLLDPGEPIVEPMATASGSLASMDRGWSAYLTLFSKERNRQADGSPRIDVNQQDLETLYLEVEEILGPQAAAFIIAYRQNRPYSGAEAGWTIGEGESPAEGSVRAFLSPLVESEETPSAELVIDFSGRARTRIDTVLDLVGARTRVNVEGQQEPVVVDSPFIEDTALMPAYLPAMMDALTAVAEPVIPGRININQAPRVILEGIPGMRIDLVDAIIANRVQDPVQDTVGRDHETWILSEGLVSLEEMKALIPFVTVRGDVYRGQFVGFFDEGGPIARIEVVIDATESYPRVVFWREISHLGPGYPPDFLGVEW